MKTKSAILCICLALLIPLSAAAKPPKLVADGCMVFVAGNVNPTTPFTVTVSRLDKYPGQWVSPEVSVEITVPLQNPLPPGTTNPNPVSYKQSVTQAFDGLGATNDAEALFVVPLLPNLQPAGVVDVTATVVEKLRKKKIGATCSATTQLVY